MIDSVNNEKIIFYKKLREKKYILENNMFIVIDFYALCNVLVIIYTQGEAAQLNSVYTSYARMFAQMAMQRTKTAAMNPSLVFA